MSDFLTKNRLVLAEVEVTAGTDPTPTPASDAVLVEEPRGTPNFELVETDEVTGSLDGSQSIVGGGYGEHTLAFYAKGSGTAATEPEFAPFLKGAGLGVTTLASDSSNTAQAGSTTTIQLASGAPSTDLTGFVVETTGGTGSGQKRVIKAYNTSTKTATVYPDFDVDPDNTTTYTVYKGNLYIPVSVSLKNITSYLYKKNSAAGDAILEKLVGAALNLSFAIQTRQPGKFNATIRGILDDPESVANPTGAVFDGTRPRPLRDADAFLDGDRVCFRNFTLDFGNQVVQGDCPGAEMGYDPARIISRKPTGRINPQLVTLADRNAFAAIKEGTTKPLWLDWGETAGNRISLWLPTINFTGKEDDDLDGISADGLPFEALGVDSWGYWLFY